MTRRVSGRILIVVLLYQTTAAWGGERLGLLLRCPGRLGRGRRPRYSSSSSASFITFDESLVLHVANDHHAFHEDTKPGDLTGQSSLSGSYSSPPTRAYSVCGTVLRGHQGVIATPKGKFPTATVAVTVFDARSITDTSLVFKFVT